MSDLLAPEHVVALIVIALSTIFLVVGARSRPGAWLKVFAAVLVVGLRQHPRLWAVGWVAALTVGYAALVGFVDAVTGADYMYLRSKPSSATLLDFLGPWPWYILSAAAVAVCLFAILDAPFRLRRRDLRQGRAEALR